MHGNRLGLNALRATTFEQKRDGLIRAEGGIPVGLQADAGMIKKLATCQEILNYANRGFVVIVAWENTSLSNPQEASPHFATVAPGYDYDEAYGCMLANVGAENGFLRETGTNNFVFGSRTPRKYFYNPNQKFRENYDIGQKTISEKNYYPSIEAMENMWGI